VTKSLVDWKSGIVDSMVW